MPGALSDSDRNFLVKMAPGLSKDPQANKVLIDTAKKLAQRDKDVARLARQYRQKNGSLNEGFYNELEQFSERNPLFSGGSGGSPEQSSKKKAPSGMPIEKPTSGQASKQFELDDGTKVIGKIGKDGKYHVIRNGKDYVVEE